MVSAFNAALHFLALGIGLGSVSMRGRYLRAVRVDRSREALNRLFTADTFWGIAAILWLVTGLLRAFAGLDKGSAFYLQNHMFWLKMSLFALVWLLEIYPMVTFIRWRIRRNQPAFAIPESSLPTLTRLNDIEVILVILIPFVASLMARGVGSVGAGG